MGKNTAEALKRAFESDSESAKGGIVVSNRPIDLETAQVLAEFKEDDTKMDVIAGTEINDEVVRLIAKIRKTTGIYVFGEIPKFDPNKKQVKYMDGGFIVQTVNDPKASFDKWEVVTKSKSDGDMRLAQFGWIAAARMDSNTVIVVDKNIPMVRGIGSGQTSRVRSTGIALELAGSHAEGGILISDSFFPFDDSVRLAAKHGIGLIVQQGGSQNDEGSIRAANEAGIPMIFTHQRIFWH